MSFITMWNFNSQPYVNHIRKKEKHSKKHVVVKPTLISEFR